MCLKFPLSWKQVENHVQMRKEAQDRYMESLLDKAYDMVVWELFKV